MCANPADVKGEWGPQPASCSLHQRSTSVAFARADPPMGGKGELSQEVCSLDGLYLSQGKQGGGPVEEGQI